MLLECGADCIEAIGVAVDGCGELRRWRDCRGDFRECGERGDGLGEATQEGGEGEGVAVEALSAGARGVEGDGVLDESVVEGFFRVVGGETAETARGSEQSALGFNTCALSFPDRSSPEGEYGAQIAGIGGGGAGEQAGELQAFAIRPEQQHSGDGDGRTEAGHAHAYSGEAPVAQVRQREQNDGGRQEEGVPGVVDRIERDGECCADGNHKEQSPLCMNG